MTVTALGFRERRFMVSGLFASGKDQARLVRMVASDFERAADRRRQRNRNIVSRFAIPDGQGARPRIEICPRRSGQLAGTRTRQEIRQVIGATDRR